MRFAPSAEEVYVRVSAGAFQSRGRAVREPCGDLGETENRRTI
jgi:hypothetical protein